MKHKLKFTITKIRRQTTESSYFNHDEVCIAEPDQPAEAESIAFFEIENPMVADQIADGFQAVQTASGNASDKHANLNMINVRKETR